MINLFKIAYRDLGRNRRRTFFSALALALGLVLLLFMAGVIRWELQSSTETSVLLQSGNLQLRASTYNEDKTSLAFQDLIENPDQVAAQIAALAPVKVATPRLYASGIVSTGDETAGVRIVGIDVASAANAPYQNGIVSGQFLTANDTGGMLIGQILADKLSLKAGDSTTLLVNTSNGSVDQQTFVIRGVYTTHTPAYDGSVVFLPLAKAQAFAQAGNHASLIFILLKDQQQAPAVMASLHSSTYIFKTFEDMNPLLVTVDDYANSFMWVLYLIVLAMVATVIINTFIMAVFERTREIGILAAIGMRGSRIQTMFFAESCLLAVLGIAMGLVVGVPLVLLVATVGIPISSQLGLGLMGFLIGDRIYTALSVNDVIVLTLMALVVTVVAAYYPARLAAHMEPVEALHGAQ
jgi:ABC-type lipoprotein release transport system permease subunit